MPNLMDETLDNLPLPGYWMHWTKVGCDGTEHDRIVTGPGGRGNWSRCRDCYYEGTLIEPRDENEAGKVFRVNAKVILSGMRRLAKKNLDDYYDHIVRGARLWVLASQGKQDTAEYASMARRFNMEDHIEAYDEDLADCVIQHGLFGEMVYG